jgi:hypothetical protein
MISQDLSLNHRQLSCLLLNKQYELADNSDPGVRIRLSPL